MAFTPPGYCHGVGITGSKEGGKDRVEVRTDLTGPGLGHSLVAGQSRWKLNQALCRKGSCSFKGLQKHKPQLLHGYDLESFVKAQSIC